MLRAALALFLLSVCSSSALAQGSFIEVKTPEGEILLGVEIVDGVGKGVALAAESPRPERDGVMVMRLPGHDFVLRTERFDKAPDMTFVVRTAEARFAADFADAFCTSRWSTEEGKSHALMSALEDGEAAPGWAGRHRDGLRLIASIYAAHGGPKDKSAPLSSSSRDRMRTRWTDGTGVEHEFVTRQRALESREDQLLRHGRAVQAFVGALTSNP